MLAYWFLLPLLVGLAAVAASAFTAKLAQRWGERAGEVATAILRNVGLPMAIVGYVMAWFVTSPKLFSTNAALLALGSLLTAVGSVVVVWAHVTLGRPAGMPTMHDTLRRSGLYRVVRHPIYAGVTILGAGLFLFHPTVELGVATALAVSIGCWFQARLEEIDLVGRVPGYREYMREVPRFIPRMRGP